MSRLRTGLRISASLAVLIVNNHAPAVQLLRTVALSGAVAPGTSVGTTFAKFGGMPTDGPVINNLGQTAFRATFNPQQGPGIGIWYEQSGVLEPANVLKIGNT